MDDYLIEEIVQKTIERMLKILPEVIGNLMTSHAANMRINKEFYERHPEFKPHKDLVREIIAKVDLENPNTGYENILKKAIPLISDGIKSKSNINMDIPTKRPSINGEL